MRSYAESEEQGRSDTEITLGMRSILGIFFGLVLICGIFFGFGYSLGRGNPGKSAAAAQTLPIPSETEPSSSVRTVVEDSPAAGKPSGAVPLPPAAAPALAQTPDAATTTAPAGPAPAAAPQVTKTAYDLPAATQPASVASPAPALAAPSAAVMVQIAAVSRRQDADVLVSALNKLGYSASVRSGTADNLLHVQIGPFATLDAARAMRAKLLNDGYNAILK